MKQNLQGHDSHGVGMLPIYIHNIKKGFLLPDTQVKTVKEAGSLLFPGEPERITKRQRMNQGIH